ncbi:Peroxyureidoacrylate/ureidoacrylate amidohydrolase RutB [Apiospora arundinis]|uniref:Peroxyureidoacrylate/ureidoacrylate amidohydrolase RutB n=1 Tax=Apiospora arundinis TaxID=335852 RepID=A0ABR2HS26_9PEZI
MAPDLSFGSGGNRWYYTRDTKTYDLTRGNGQDPEHGFTLATTQGPTGTSITIDPAQSALVVVDMQNYFLDARCRDYPAGLATVEPLLKVIGKCREVGVQVIWLNWGLREIDLPVIPASVQRSFSRSLIDPSHTPLRHGLGADLGDGKGRTLMAGEWNAEIYAPLVSAGAVRPEDVQCAKDRMSGLWNESQPLCRHLEDTGTNTLLFAGVNTDQCVLSTLTDAYNQGWDCVMVEDCCATTTPNGQGVCLWNVANSYGFVVDSKSFANGALTR